MGCCLVGVSGAALLVVMVGLEICSIKEIITASDEA